MRPITFFVFSWWVVLVGWTSPAHASAKGFFDSLVRAIDVADAQARISLDSGTWKSTIENVDLIWRIPRTTVPEFGLHYLQGQIISDPKQQKVTYIQFPTEPGFGNTYIDVTINKTVQNTKRCATFRIFRLEFNTGGTLNGNSRVELRPATPECPGQASFFDLALFLHLADTPQEMFKGRVFTGLGSKAKIVRCKDVNCVNTIPDTGPITEIDFFGFGNGITFKGNQEIRFSQTAAIRLNPASRIEVNQLRYHVGSESGIADFSNSMFFIKSGLIQIGTTTLDLKEQTKAPTFLSFPTIVLRKEGDLIQMSDGQLDVGLGSHSVISLMAHPEYPSSIHLDTARAKFLGLSFAFGANRQEVAARQASFDISAQSTTLGFAADNWVRLGYSGFDLVLGCQDLTRAERECPGFSWSRDRTILIGTLSKIGGRLQGGRFALGNAGYSRIQGGEFYAEGLAVDTRNETPVTGTISKLKLDLSGENIWIDKSTKIKAATIEIDSDDIRFSAKEKYPFGSLKVKGTVSEVTGGVFDELPVNAATVDAVIGRQERKTPEILSGTLKANLSLRDDAATGTVDLALRRIQYYDGRGKALLDFEFKNASYKIQTEGRVWKDSGMFANVTVDLKSILIDLSLEGSIKKEDIVVEVVNGKWNIDPISSPFSLRIPFAEQELVYGLLEAAVGPNCTSKVKLVPGTYHINGNVGVALSTRSFAIKDVSLDRGVEIAIDDGSCGDVVKAACWMAGNVLLPGLGGPVAALLCGKEINKKKQEYSDKFRDLTSEKVKNLSFRAGR
jgi:hypothetical protein